MSLHRRADVTKLMLLSEHLPEYGFRRRRLFFTGIILGSRGFGILKEERSDFPKARRGDEP